MRNLTLVTDNQEVNTLWQVGHMKHLIGFFCTDQLGKMLSTQEVKNLNLSIGAFWQGRPSYDQLIARRNRIDF